jgi:hypothetical protein
MGVNKKTRATAIIEDSAKKEADEFIKFANRAEGPFAALPNDKRNSMKFRNDDVGLDEAIVRNGGLAMVNMSALFDESWCLNGK